MPDSAQDTNLSLYDSKVIGMEIHSCKAASSPSKRFFDFALSFLLLVLLSPALILIALLVRLESRGPAIFKQKRTGLQGHIFYIWKFRSMRSEAECPDVRQARPDDSRVTRLGRLLRRSSLDELPQLVNIFKGDMSFVGPRPHAIEHDTKFAQLVPNYHSRFMVRPGLTGLAQIRGHRGEILNARAIEDRVLSDIEYAHSWSISSDFKIIIKTIPLILNDKNAY